MPTNRRTFIKTAALTTAASLAIPQLVKGNPNKVSQLKKPVAIAMWDYSWILRHHRYGEFEDWDKALEGLAERGYNAIRMDAMPQFVAADTNKKLELEFRAVKDGWKPACWGNDYTMSFRPRDALCEFLPKCKKYGIKVGLASWFLAHGTGRKNIFMEKDGLQRAWLETLEFLSSHELLDNVIYVDLLNEYPNWHGYDWLKNELNKRSDVEKFKLNNPNANVPDMDMKNDAGNLLKQQFYNDFANTTITAVKNKFPDLDVFVSLDSAMKLDRIDLSNFGALDYHVWFHHRGNIPGLGDISKRDQTTLDYRQVNQTIKEYWKNNNKSLVEWMHDRIAEISKVAKQHNIVCGNTEGWGPIWWFDHPELDWEWVKESAEICVDMALDYNNYKFICTSNFTHPQFKGLWEQKIWHRHITDRIKNR